VWDTRGARVSNKDVAPLPLGGSLAVWLDWNGDLILFLFYFFALCPRWPPPLCARDSRSLLTCRRAAESGEGKKRSLPLLRLPPPRTLSWTSSLIIKYSTPFFLSIFFFQVLFSFEKKKYIDIHLFNCGCCFVIRKDFQRRALGANWKKNKEEIIFNC
jgi:hypothetical protein